MSKEIRKNKNDNTKLSVLKGRPIKDIYCRKHNLGNLLIEAAESKSNAGILFINEDYSEVYLSYSEILERAYRVLGSFEKLGIKKGEYAILIIDENIDFVISFWACILGGIIPVPLTHPTAFTEGNAIVDKIISIWNSLRQPVLIVDEKMKNNYNLFIDSLGMKEMRILGTQEIAKDNTKGNLNLADVKSPAFIQFSSGSTNSPKGVVLTHENILINVESMVNGAKLCSEDTIVSWMPFSHDMGLIGFHIAQIAVVAKIINVTTLTFIKNPSLWMDLISKHKATVTCSPNFGYKLLLNKVTEEHLNSWKLSSLRLIINGAEPISTTLVNVFLDKLSCCGLKRTSMIQAYGMAEASLTITLSPLEKESLCHCLSRKKMTNESKAEISNENTDDSMFIADLGYVVDGMELRIVDSKGKIVLENTVGEIQIKGRNITPGYLNNPQLNSEVFKDGWFNTGDMGFVVNGRLSITGRMKDIIFVNGQNFYAHDVEDRIGALEGVEAGKIAICAWQDESENREKVALFSELSVNSEFYSKIISFVSETIGINIDYIILVNSIPKTVSGKIQRFALMKAFKDNKYCDSTYAANELFINNSINEDKAQVKNTILDKDNYLKEIKDAWAKALELPKETIPLDKSFLALGGNSIKAIQLLSYLEEDLNITLSHDILIKCATIVEMDEYLLRFFNKEASKQCNAEAKDLKEEVKLQTRNSYDTGDIAVISMACRFPEAKSLEEFWSNLSQGKSSFTEIPNNRWKVNQYYNSSKKQGKTYCHTGAFIDNPYAFDAKFFNIPEEEAEIMDPQQRIILELVYETLENSGYSKQYVDGKNIGVFAGAGTNNYFEYHLNTLNMNNIKEFSSFHNLSEEQRNSFMEEWKNRLGFTEDHPNLLVDNILNMVAARASHEFNFKGPSLTVDTACSSSLVTIHLACDAIRRNECEMAIAGGINLLLTPTPYIYFSSAGALSKTGQSKVFDVEADGFVPGEGGGLVLLKSLEKALEDEDEILAVIKGSAVNNDGHSIGVMAPNPDGQRSVIEALYSRKNIDPKEIQYVEAHGTGTRIGDPSEVRALAQAFSKWKPENQSIAIGSVKANIGHLLNAAGIASFIKVVLALKNKKIPPNVNLSTPNPMIKFTETPFYLTENTKDWKVSEGIKRRAAINSFGFGGTNCHMLIEEAPASVEVSLEGEDREDTLPKQVLCLTAHTEEALRQKISNLAAFLKEHKNNSLGDICYTENNITTVFKHRCSVVSASVDELIEKLDKLTLEDTSIENSPKVAFMFTGQGCQYVGMARVLYNTIPEFKEYVDMCSEAFYPYIGEKITDLIYAENAEEKILAQTNITQPVVFTLDYSLGKLLIALGVKPACVLGHSVGEWAAACVAEVISLKDAAKIVSARGRLMNDLKIPGAMAAVFTTGDRLEALIKNFNKQVWIAAYNGNHQVISGSSESVDEFSGILEKNGIAFKRLKVSQAFHTPLMEPMLKEFQKELEGIQFKEANIPIVSNITAEFIDKPLDSQYWLKHILSPVKFEQSIKFIKSRGINTFVEAGPDKTLTGMATAVLMGSNTNVLSMQNRKKDNLEVFLETIGNLYCVGLKIDWTIFQKNSTHKRVKLPGYPFQRKTYGPKFGDASIDYDAPNNWFYKWQWTEEENIEEKNRIEGPVVIFNDAEGIGNELAKKFIQDNNLVYFVEAGKEFNYDGKSNFTINPHKKEDYNNIFKELPHKPSLIVHLWNLPYSNFGAEDILSKDELLDETLYSIFNIGQAVKTELDNNISFTVVTDKAQFINEKYTVSGPHQSLSTVLAQAIDEDNNNFSSHIIDVDIDEYKTTAELAEKIFNELHRKIDEEGIVVIRNNKSFVRKLEKLYGSEDRLRINAGETYLITGGTSPLGGDIARELAKQAKVNLILTGRSVLPEREQWRENFHSDSIKEKIKVILDLENMGAKVIYASVDVTDKSTMENLVSKINAEYGNIHGVVHAAGVLDYSSFKLLNKDVNILKKVFDPKLQGTIITDLVTRKEPLKFFVMISSVSATKKKWSQGLGEYAAANSFLNAYTHYRKGENAAGKTIAVNYSLWDNKGMGAMFGKSAANAIKAQGLRPLEAHRAASAFLSAISVKGESNIHIIDLIEEAATEKVQITDKVESTVVKENRVVSYLEAKEVKNTVYKVIAEQLKIPMDNLDIGMNFLELGLDSVGAMKAIESLSKALRVELYPTIIFEYQTPEALSNHIENSYFATSEIKKEKDIDKVAVDKEIDDIAIIGISLRIPGADSLDEYWNILDKGIVTTREIPKERWSTEDEYNLDKDCPNTSYSKCGGFINKPYDFDPIFFGISPREAEAMDPQQRIFLEVAWEALQEAGYGGRYKTNNIGVFVGAEQNNYMEHFSNYRNYMILKDRFEKSKWFNSIPSSEKKKVISTLINVLKPAKLKADAVPGNGLNEIATRVSHCLNLMGPSIVVNTACSSSLVALHMACENIRTKQSDMAIVGGVNLNLSSIPFISMSKLNAISPTGECRPFDKDADGMILSEGVSAIVIKPLKMALKDGDNIYASIKGSAINNDGHSQGITAPRPQGQATAVENAYRNARINPETISYIEAHGTGTPLGDPIEVEGMTKAFRSFTEKKDFCAIGSVKSSIGHMLAASGLVSLIKVVLAMKNKKLPYTVNYETSNTNINFKNTPFFVVERESMQWKSDGKNPLRAGVNAFGFGGTNAHIVLEESPVSKYKEDEDKITNEYILQLTGKNDMVIRTIAKRLQKHIERNPKIALSSLCVTMNNSQKQLAYKNSLVVDSKQNLLHLLNVIQHGEDAEGLYRGKSNPNRDTTCHLLLDGNIFLSEGEIEKLRSRFEIFHNFYSQCEKEIEKIKTFKEVNDEIKQKIKIFSVEYALGCVFADLEIKFESIIARRTGILSSAVLIGELSIREAIVMIVDEVNLENQLDNDNRNIHFRCTVVTALGILNINEDKSSFIKKALSIDKLSYELRDIVKKNEVIVYLGASKLIEKEIAEFSIEEVFLQGDITVYPERELLALLAKLYTLGVAYNPRNIYPKGILKTPLPTYPFENSAYKVSFEEDMDQYDKNDVMISKTIITDVDLENTLEVNDRFEMEGSNDLLSLVKISSSKGLSRNEKQVSYEKLSFDFNLDKPSENR
jgi:acyl transferase domain-containing protein/acyl-CoA synthetase (AMP-forming)/AMP-acid ligase II/NAD(P)-dependent dehydrogenase (short-subunit alcohol dehydrogenase family)/acyl carrier protein